MLAGGMAEWSMAVVLKTTKVQAFGGSNPSPSARAPALISMRLSLAKLRREPFIKPYESPINGIG